MRSIVRLLILIVARFAVRSLSFETSAALASSHLQVLAHRSGDAWTRTTVAGLMRAASRLASSPVERSRAESNSNTALRRRSSCDLQGGAPLDSLQRGGSCALEN